MICWDGSKIVRISPGLQSKVALSARGDGPGALGGLPAFIGVR
jgi:hypothetical protein